MIKKSTRVMNKIKKLVCIGDSLTDGWQLGQDQAWTNLLEQELSVTVINSGIAGDTTAGMLARLKTMAIDYKPSHIMITGGTNDLWLGVAMANILANILAMKRLNLYHKIETIIGLPTPFYPPDDDYANPVFTDNNTLAQQIQIYRHSLRNFCAKAPTPFIDFASGFSQELMLADGLHPNAKGHELMKDNALTLLEGRV